VWALAVRHCRRAFIYWTYVAALARNSAVRVAAERLAQEALSDGNVLRRERRLAWQVEHKQATQAQRDERDASAALLESLLRRDIIAWSQTLPPAEGRQLLHVGMPGFPPHGAIASEEIEAPGLDEIEQVKQRALRRAEQLSNVYLDEADRAKDQSSLEFAQELATQSIARLAGLRAVAAASSGKPAR
jgi:phage I-like protein